MEYLRLAIVPFMVGILMPLVLGVMHKHNLKKEAKMKRYDFVISTPSYLVILGIFITIFVSTILILLNIFAEVRLEVNVILISFIIFFLVGTYALIREKVVVKKDIIIVTPAFGRTKTYKFSEIKKLKKVSWSNGMTSYKVYKDKKIFSIPDNLPGFHIFMKRIKEEKIEIEE